MTPRTKRGMAGWFTRRRKLWLWAALVLALLAGGFAILQSVPGSNRLIAQLLNRQDSTWQTMRARGVWRVGLDPSFPPFETLDAAGKPSGFDVDLARLMADKWGLQTEIVALGFDSLLDALKAGKIDSVVSALPYDPRTTRDYAFSTPYFEAGIRLAVRRGSSITGAADLAQHKIAVEWGSTGDMVGRRLQRQESAIQLIPFSTPEEAIDALVHKPEIDALLIDNVTLRQAQGKGANIVAVGPALESNPYVIAAPWTANTLQQKIDATLQQLQQSGELDQLEAKWFGPLAQ